MNEPIKRNILLNPGPATTTDSVKYALVVPDICPREKEFCRVMVEVRQKLVKVVNGGDKHTAIVFAASGTGGVEACLSSVVPPGKKILVVINGAYGTRMAKIAEIYYGKERVLKYEIKYGRYPNIDDLQKLIEDNKDLSHIGVIHHETTTGMLNPVKDVCRIAHEKNIEVIVDAMSSYAGIVIDIEKDGFDYIISSANKCIQGMAGLTFVITAKEKLDKAKDYPKNNLYFNMWEQHAYFEKTGEMRYTPPVQIIYALNKALDEFFVETAEKRYRRFSDSWQVLTDGLKKLGFEFFLPLDQHSRILTAVLEPDRPGYDFNEMHDYLYSRGYTIYPGKLENMNTFRVANMGAIDKEDIKKFLAVLEEYLKSKGL